MSRFSSKWRRFFENGSAAFEQNAWGSLSGVWVPHGTRDQTVDFVRRQSEKTEISAGRFIEWLDITAGKFYGWRERYGEVNEHYGWVQESRVSVGETGTLMRAEKTPTSLPGPPAMVYSPGTRGSPSLPIEGTSAGLTVTVSKMPPGPLIVNVEPLPSRRNARNPREQ
jgi:hypothetical protein